MQLSRSLSESIVEGGRRVSQVDELVSRAAAELGGVLWRHVGSPPNPPNVNNCGTCTVSSDKRAPVAEVVFNMFDSHIQLAHLLSGMKASTPHEAVRKFPGLDPAAPGWKGVHMSIFDSEEGPEPEEDEDEDEKRPKRLTLEFRDHGHGDRADRIPHTFLSLHGDSKISVPWLCGKFGIGLKSSFRYAERLVLVTRPHPTMLDGGDPHVSFTVVQKVRNEDDKLEHYDYLCGPDGEMIRLDLPGFSHGSLIRLVSYDMQDYHGKIQTPNNSALLFLNSFLIDPPLPLEVHDRREKKAVNMTVRGLKHSLDAPKKANALHRRIAVGVEFEGSMSDATVDYYVLHADASPRDPSGTKVKSEQSLTFSHNGQRHAAEGRGTMRRILEVGVAVAPRLVVVVDTSGLHPSACGNLYSSNRINADSGSSVYRQIISAMREALAADEDFQRISRESSERKNDEKSGDTEMLENLVAEMISDAVSSEGGGGKGNRGVGASGGRGGKSTRNTDDSAFGELPTRISIVNSPLKAPRGRFAHLTLEVDAKNHYLSPGDGRLKVDFDPSTGAYVSSCGELLGGSVRLTVRVPGKTALGSTPFTARILDPENGVDISASGTVEVVEPKKGRPGNGNGSAEEGGGRIQPVCVVDWIYGRDPGYPDNWDEKTPGEASYVMEAGIPTMRILLNGDFGRLPAIQRGMSKGRMEAFHRRRNEYAAVLCGMFVNVEVRKMEPEEAFAEACLNQAFKGSAQDARDPDDAAEDHDEQSAASPRAMPRPPEQAQQKDMRRTVGWMMEQAAAVEHRIRNGRKT